MARPRVARPTTRRVARPKVEHKAGETVDRGKSPLDSKPTGDRVEGMRGELLSADPADVVDVPDRVSDLGPQGEADAMPRVDQPEAGGAHKPVDDLAAKGIESPKSDFEAPEVEDEDPAFLDDLEEILAGPDGYGGADGRNAGSDLGGSTMGMDTGQVPEPDLSVAGKVTPEVQARLDQYKADAMHAAEEGNFDKVNEIAEEVHTLVQGGTVTEPVGYYGSFNPSGTTQEWDPSTGEVVEVDHSKSSDSASTPPTPDTENHEDRAPDSEAGPEIPGLDEFIDDYHEQETGSLAIADVDPDPMSDPADASVELTDYDPTDMVAEYDPGYTEVDMDVEGAAEMLQDAAVPDEEFMDIDG